MRRSSSIEPICNQALLVILDSGHSTALVQIALTFSTPEFAECQIRRHPSHRTVLGTLGLVFQGSGDFCASVEFLCVDDSFTKALRFRQFAGV